MKKTIFIFLILFLLIAGWSGGWFFVADKMAVVIDDTKTRLADRGQTITCTDQEIGGFPFRLNLNCSQTGYDNARTGITLKAGALRSAAQAYQPNQVVAELDGPANIILPDGRSFDTQWKSMRTSAKVGLGGPDRFSVSGQELSVDVLGRADESLDMSQFQLHGRKVDENSVDLSSTMREVVSRGDLWPQFSLNTTIRFDDIYSDLVRQPNLVRIGREKGLRGNITNLVYELSGGGSVTATGPIEVDRDGILTAQLSINAKDLPKLIEALNKVVPGKEKEFSQAQSAAQFLSKATADGSITIPISVKQGRVAIGIIPIGEVPKLY